MRKHKYLIWGIVLMLIFIGFTCAVKFIDVSSTKESLNSAIGFSRINLHIKKDLGVHHFPYYVSEICGYALIATGLFFAGVGFVQLCKRKLDPTIVGLGVLYAVTIGFYILFDKVIVINMRPTALEPSYPSSHTLLALVFGGAAIIQAMYWIEDTRKVLSWAGIIGILMAFTMVGRAMSGVHWATDIFGSVFLGMSLLSFYIYFVDRVSG